MHGEGAVPELLGIGRGAGDAAREWFVDEGGKPGDGCEDDIVGGEHVVEDRL